MGLQEEAIEGLRVWLLELCRSLVDEPHRAAVEVETRSTAYPGEEVAFLVTCSDRAFGGLVGERGRNADAIRWLTRVRCRAVGQGTLRTDVRVRNRDRAWGSP